MFVINPYLLAPVGFQEPPPAPASTNLRYRFDAASSTYKDAAGSIACQNGDGVQVWGNLGLASDDGVQPVAARRPIFRTGGINGLPYLECRQVNQQFFNDLLEGGQPDNRLSSPTYNQFTVVAVVKQSGLANSSIFGWPSGGVGLGTVDLYNDGGGLALRWCKTYNVGFGSNQWSTRLPEQSGGINIVAASLENLSIGWSGTNTQNKTAVYQGSNPNWDPSNGMGFLRAGGNTACADFDIYELYYYNTNLSSTDLNTLLNTLRVKYGLPTVP